MKIYLVIASINELKNIGMFKPDLEVDPFDLKVLIIDEGDARIREKNKEILSGLTHAFYGPNEREKWFKAHFGTNYKKYSSVIPERCHAETSFGFLVAYEEKPDFVLELDDDVFPFQNQEILRMHSHNLFHDNGIYIDLGCKWYNTIENLDLNKDLNIFPRGHPYNQETRMQKYSQRDGGEKCVLNMGLWAGHPDLDALTILFYGGMNGLCDIKSLSCKRNKIIVPKGSYFAICSMNTSFLPEITPAFYQLYMNFKGVDRFDDIWSGLFLKKVADHLEQRVCLGTPLVYHDKRPRDTFKDLKKELDGMIINEVLWRIVDESEINGKNYWDSYSSLIYGLEKYLEKFQNSAHRNFMSMQTKKMKMWLRIIDKIE